MGRVEELLIKAKQAQNIVSAPASNVGQSESSGRVQQIFNSVGKTYQPNQRKVENVSAKPTITTGTSAAAPRSSLRTTNRDAFDSPVRKNYQNSVTTPTIGQVNADLAAKRTELTQELDMLNNGTGRFTDEGKARIAEIEVELKNISKQEDEVDKALQGDRTDAELHQDAFLYGAGKVGTGLLGVGEGINDFVGSTFYGLAGAGLDLVGADKAAQWSMDKAASYLDNSITRDLNQKLEEKYMPTNSMKFAGNVNETVSSMLPGVGVSKAIAGVGNAMNAANQMQKAANAGKAVMGLQAAGKSAQEAKSEGATTGQALLYGGASGVLEATIESIAGGIPGMGGGAVQELTSKLTSNPSVAKILDIVGEGGEEALSTFLTPYLQRAIYNPDAKNATVDEIAESAAMGMIASGVLQVGFELPGVIGTKSGSVQGLPTVSQAQTVELPPVVDGQKNTASKIDAAENTRLTDNDLDEYLKVGDRQHVRDMKMGQIRSGDSPILTTLSQIKSFISNAVNGGFRNTIKAYGRVGRKMAADIASAASKKGVSGFEDISGYYLELEANHLDHLSDHINDDGDPRNIPLTDEQTANLTEYIDAYDDILDFVKKKDGSVKIYLGKKINGHAVIVEMLSKGRSSLHPVTAWQNTTEHYLKKYGKAKTQVDTSQPPTEVGGESGYKPTSANPNVPQVAPGVKNEYTLEQGAQSVEGTPAEENLLGVWDTQKPEADTSLLDTWELKNPEAGVGESYWDSIMEEQPLPFSETDVDGYMESLLDAVDQRLGRAIPKDTPVTEEFEPVTKKKGVRQRVKEAVEGKNPKEIDVVKEVVNDPDVTSAGEGVAAIAQVLTSSGISYNKDLARNLDAAAGGNTKVREDLRNLIERPFLAAKANYARNVRNQLNDLKTVMDGLGIKKGSEESAAVQRYGEKQYQDKDGEVHEYTETMLRSQFPNTWQNIVKAEQYARRVYDSYVDQINATLEGIYPRVLDKALEESARYTERAAQNTEMAAQQKNTYNALSQRQSALQEQLSKTREGTQRYADIQNSIMRLGQQMDNVQAKIRTLQDQADVNNAKAAAVNARIASGDILRNKRVPKRADYFHHFNEMAEGWAGLANILTTPSDVDSKLAGTSDNTRPKTKWAGFMQGRQGGKYTEDAVGGLLAYIPQAEYKVNLDPIIAENRKTIKTLAEETEKTRNANKFIEWMTDWTNDLAGKTNPFDRAIQKVVGRKATSVAKWMSSRAKANAVVGNVRSATAQVFNLPNAVVYVKSPAAWAKGAKIYSSALAGNTTAKSLFEESGFLTERYMDDAISQFDEGILKQPEKFANWMLTVGDKEVAKLIWASAYEQGRANGTADPVEYADDITRRSIAGRGVGEIPLLQKATYTQLFAPFQIEVNNTWQLLKENAGEGNWGGILAMFALSFLMNSATRELFGYEVGIDPFNALIESAEEWDAENIGGSITSTAGRLGGEFLSNMPFGAQIGAIAVSDETAREELFGDADPSRFGTGNIGINALADTVMSGIEAVKEQDITKLDVMTPLTNFALPFGGKQMGRIVEGAQSLGMLPTFSKNGAEPLPDAASLTDNGGLRFAIDEEDPADVAKLFAFGPFSTSGGVDYLEQGYTALGETQTAAAMEAAKHGVDLTDYMTAYRGMSGMSEAEKRSYIQQMELTDTEKAYIYRYSMLSSASKENERTLFDDLVSDGMDAGVVGSMLMAMKDAESSSDKLEIIAQTELSDSAAKSVLGSIMGSELKTEKGGDTEYAKLLKVIGTDLSTADAIQMKADGLDLDQFLEFEAAGVDAKAAYELMEKLDQLKPKNGSDSITNLQKYRAVVDSGMSDQNQMDVLGIMMGESEYSKLQVGYDYGVAPDVYVDYKETAPRYDADGNGNYTQAETRAAIDAMDIDDVGMKAALWQLANKSWKPEKNPYNVNVGRKVYEAMH